MKIIIAIIAIACILFYIKPAFRILEGLTGASGSESMKVELPNCPNMLMEKDGKYYLFNKNKPYEEGKNPIEFDNLEDYSNFVKRENKRGNKCPVLYLQQSYNTQGEREYKIRPSHNNLQGGAPPIMGNPNNKNITKQTYLNMFKGTGLLVDAGESDKPYNENLYPSFDPMDQQIGQKTPLDLMDMIQQTKDLSPNPDDPNWGGNAYTQNLITNGYYADNSVKVYVD